MLLFKWLHDEGDNITYSNTVFDLRVGNSDDFMDSAEKNDAAIYHNLVIPNRIEEKIIDLTPDEISHWISKLEWLSWVRWWQC